MTSVESVSLAFCSFCSAPDDAVNVICEGRCLICYRCQRSHGIRQLLTRCIDNGQSNDSASNCPLCAQPMAPNMISTIRKYRKDATVVETSENADFSLLQPNPFLPYLRKTKCTNDLPNSCTTPTAAVSPPKINKLASTKNLSVSRSRSAKRIQFAIEEAASLNSQNDFSTSTQPLSVDLNYSVSNRPASHNVNKRSAARVVTVIPPLSMQISESFVMDCIAEMYIRTYEAATKDMLELPFPLLWRHLSKNRFNKHVVAQKLHLFLTYVVDVVSPYISGAPAVATAEPIHIKQSTSSNNNNTRSPVVLSRRHSKSQQLPQRNTQQLLSVTSQYNLSHIYIFAANVLGVLPIAESVRPNSAYLTTFLYTAVLFSERAVRQGAVWDIKAGVPSPSCHDVSAKLRAYLTDGVTSTNHISVRKCISIIRLLLSSRDSQWSISQLHGACVEFGSAYPWQSQGCASKFLGAFVSFAKEYCSSAANGGVAEDGNRKYRHASVAAASTAMCVNHFQLIENLPRLVEETWHAGGSAIALSNISDFIPPNLSVPPALFVIFCLCCWKSEYDEVARNIRLSQISISRRQATYPTVDPQKFEPLTLAEQIALKHIYDMFVQYEDSVEDESILRKNSAETKGFIDWELVQEKVSARDVPFSVPKSLLNRSVMELEYRILPLQKQHLQREIQKCVELSGWDEEWCWRGVTSAPEDSVYTVASPTRYPPKRSSVDNNLSQAPFVESACSLTEHSTATDVTSKGEDANNKETLLCHDDVSEQRFEPTCLASYFDGMNLKPFSAELSSLDRARSAGQSSYSRRRRPQTTPHTNTRGQPSPMSPAAAPSSLSCTSALNLDANPVKLARHKPNMVDIVHGVITNDVLEKAEMLPSHISRFSSSPRDAYQCEVLLSRPHTSGPATRDVIDLAHYSAVRRNEVPSLPIGSKIAEIYLQDTLRGAPESLHSLLRACLTRNTENLSIVDLSNNKYCCSHFGIIVNL